MYMVISVTDDHLMGKRRGKRHITKVLILSGTLIVVSYIAYLFISPERTVLPAVNGKLQKLEQISKPKQISKLNYRNQIRGRRWHRKMSLSEISEPLYRKPVPVPKPDTYHRLVHLDLKGAPPKFSYLVQVIPLFAKWGATGLLVEYEDTFPYRDELSVLQVSDAYTLEETQRLQEVAQENGMEFIPLIQTFGHFEFVLKHQKFAFLREVPETPQALCPSKEESFNVVKRMIDQIVESHPNLRYLHIGADEVVYLGRCDVCQSRLETEFHGSRERLFLSHVVRTLRYIHDTYPHVQPIMWDDMFRHVNASQLKAYDLGNLVEPMIWNYKWNTELFHRTVPTEVWGRYSEVFSNIWVASAFKGASGVAQYYVDIAKHIGNHHLWLDVVNQEVPANVNLKGYALTGWQRYDHYAVLCELLPAGLPSLAFCLQTLIEGGFNERIHQNVSQSLGFKKPLQLSLDMLEVSDISSMKNGGDFPGSTIFSATMMLVHLEYSEAMQKLYGNPMARFEGWMTEFQLEHHLTDPGRMQLIYQLANKLWKAINPVIDVLERELPETYQQRSVMEWMQTTADPLRSKLSSIREKSEQAQHEVQRVQSPDDN